MIQSSIKRILNHHIGKNSIQVIDEKSGILRCEKSFHNKAYQILYVDCSNIWLKEDFKIKDLESYQEKFLLQDYYKHSGSLQWNFYYAFITAEEQINKNIIKKREIESDELYTRKLVLSEEELNQWLSKIENLSKPSNAILEKDLGSIWINELKKNKLDAVFLDTVTYKLGVESYMNNEPIEAPKEKEGENNKQNRSKEKISLIKSLNINTYRNQPKDVFNFKKVNLIKGINGAGKTSLLEAIELVLCGKSDRNPEGDNSNTDLKITLGNGESLEYTSGNNRLFKSRDKTWYNNPNQQYNRLHVSFSKYNFYNTDAAYALSLNPDKGNIKKALEDIALGEEVNEIENRLLGFYDRFRSEYNRYNNLVSELESQLNKEQRLIKGIKNLDKSPEQFFKELIKEANRIKWKRVNDLPEKLIPQFEKDIASAKFYLQSIKNTIKWESSISHNWLLVLSEELSKTNNLYSDNNSQIKSKGVELSSLELQEVKLKNINKLLIELKLYFDEPRLNELLGLTDKLKKSNQEFSQLQNAKEIIGEIDLSNLDYFSIEKKISEIDSELNLELMNKENELKMALNRKKELELGFNQLEKVVGEIKSKGNEYISLVPSATNCPLCHAEYLEHELSGLIQSSWENIQPTKILEEILTQIAQYEKEINNLNEKKSVFSKIKLVNTLLSETTSAEEIASEVIKGIKTLPAKLSALESSLNDLSGLDSYFEIMGISEEAYEELINDLVELEIHVNNKKTFNQALKENEKNLKKLEEELVKIKVALDELKNNNSDLLKKSNLESFDSLKKRREALADAKESFDELLKLIESKEVDKLFTIEKNVDKLQELFVQYKDIKREKDENDAVLNASKKEVERIRKKIKENIVYRDRAEKAYTVIDDLQQAHNKSEYLADFIDKNKAEISEIYKMIHSPKEFEGLNFMDNGKISLKRKNDDNLAQLTEISTGQRSALALSIFSALNRKLKNGPDIMMFDDPVANIDDLNILSYFDYLREVAMKGNRQIFFATANENAAFLFKQKFDFLGEDLEVIELKGFSEEVVK